MNAIAPIRAAYRAEGPADRIAAAATRALHLEVDTHPKPGLVSHHGQGAHRDMDAGLLHRSADALRPFFGALAVAGGGASALHRLRGIGIAAEQAMLATTGGVNTHRGAIFGLGLLAAAAGLRHHTASRPELGLGLELGLGWIVAATWGAAILAAPAAADTHGAAASRRYGVGGARAEAAAGYPSIYRIALPALREAIRAGHDAEAARVQACFALIGAVDDTNLLHRGGAAGLAYAKHQAAAFLRAGGVGQPGWEACAAQIHADFTARNLSPGGAADLLAMTLFVHQADVLDR